MGFGTPAGEQEKELKRFVANSIVLPTSKIPPGALSITHMSWMSSRPAGAVHYVQRREMVGLGLVRNMSLSNYPATAR
jgi:hypothetical protein